MWPEKTPNSVVAAECHSAENPSIRRAVAEAAEDGFVDVHRQVDSWFENASAVPRHQHQKHQEPVANQKHCTQQHLEAHRKVDQGHGGHKVADGDGLQGVGERMEPGVLEVQQVALGDQSQNPKDDHAAEDFEVQGGLSLSLLEALAKRERHGGADDERE